MTAIEGKLLTCDCCGETIFLKYIGDGETDGGYTRWRKYEKADGWDSLRIGDYNLANICPKCLKEMQDAVRRIADE